nr:MAG TPA: hypothetical protein [Caudoviricetes sp.]
MTEHLIVFIVVYILNVRVHYYIYKIIYIKLYI